MKVFKSLNKFLTLRALGLGLLAVACSDGGGSDPVVPNPPSGGGGVTGPTWTQGVFAASSQFAQRCENPRSGVDIEGNPFPDVQGTLAEELFWLRSWTNETYLWNDEVTDQSPYNFTDRLSYFAVLKTFATTASGKDKDDFHFSEPTEDFLEARNSAPTSGYGVRYIAIRTAPPRDFRIGYTEAGSPAEALSGGLPSFQRGARILEVDGVDLVNAGSSAAVDALNAGLFPATAGETHTFLMRETDGTERTVSITSADVTQDPVRLTSVINTPTGDVGYILFNTFSPFSSEEEIADAISAMQTAGVSDLVLDLRYNGGGLLAIAAQLSYMVAGDAATVGRVFENLRFNADAGGVNPVTGSSNNAVPFYSTGLGFSLPNGTALDTLDLPRVFILTTGDTCSASEAVVNGLRGIGIEVILIGERTCGKPFGFYPTDNCGETYYTIQFQGVNDAGFGDYADGFVPTNSTAPFGVRTPGCAVADDLTKPLGDPTEGLLAAALQYREDGSCPPAASSSSPGVITLSAAIRADGVEIDGLARARELILTNRDLRMPNESAEPWSER